MDSLSARYGRRGAWLIILGAVWFVFGLGVLLDPIPPRPGVLSDYLPAWVDAAGWWVTGVVAVAAGLRGDREDWWGHVALYVMPAVRLVSFAFSWLLWLGSSVVAATFPDAHVLGWAPGWYAASVWLLVSLMLRLIADWPNPVDHTTALPFPPGRVIGRDER